MRQSNHQRQVFVVIASKVVLFALVANGIILGFRPRTNILSGESPVQAESPIATQSANNSEAAVPKELITKLNSNLLPNLLRVHEKVLSGGLPEGDDAFAELKALGVKTAISVDGAKPDVLTAEKHGIRYVHLPHGYDGISSDRANDLAKAVRDLPGPIYIHCHHGKHRSPAAAAVACVSAGLMTPEDAPRILEIAGTSANYRGLFESVRNAKPLTERFLDSLVVTFPSTAKIPPLAEAMIAFEHTLDHLKLLEASNWTQSPRNPDLDPAHESLLMREHYTELLRTDDVKQRSPRFAALLREGEESAQVLENAIRNRLTARTSTMELSANLKKLSDTCAACHRQFRDVPLSEKQR